MVKIDPFEFGLIKRLSPNLICQKASLSEYPQLDEIVYAPQECYYNGRKDDYSSKLYYSKKEPKAPYFMSRFIFMIDELTERRILRNLDLITIVPRGIVGEYSVTLDELANTAAEHLSVRYEKVIQRVKNTSVKTHKPLIERLEEVKGSMVITHTLNGVNKVMVIDDVKTSGTTTLEVKKLLLESGAKEIVSVRLGINVRLEGKP